MPLGKLSKIQITKGLEASLSADVDYNYFIKTRISFEITLMLLLEVIFCIAGLKEAM